MNTKVINLDLDENKRILFVSDIHGNVELLNKALIDTDFSSNDYLFILGDFIEKAYDNISMIDYIMELDKKENVYVLQGNCDNVLDYMIKDVDEELLRFYVLKKKNTILLDFARRLNVEITEKTSLEHLCQRCYKEFRKYYDFVLNLPHAYIINNKICAVHGGIDDLSNIDNNAINLMKNDGFYFKNINPSMIEIVGHYPTINYNNKIPSLNPIIDLNKKIISIDGGVSVIPWNQLNVLILDSLKSFNFSYKYFDSYKKAYVIEDEYNENNNLFNVTIKPIRVDISEYDDDFYIGKYQDKSLYILRQMLIEHNDEYYVYNAFNYFHSLTKGEEVSLVYYGKNISIIKKDGIVGLCHTRSLNRHGAEF